MLKTIHGVVGRKSLTPFLTDIRIFSTHGGTGLVNQYINHPNTKVEFDKLFDASLANTTLSWTGSLSASTSLNWSVYTTLTGAGAVVPNTGNYFSLEATFVFVPKETGTYTFSIDSDDGSDLYVDGNLITSYYGGHGTGQGSGQGTYNLVQGVRYTMVARAQEFTGGEGLIVKWKRPSQGMLSLQTDEVFQPR